MIIGVDCDGVLTDMSAYIFKYGEKWFGRKPVNPNGSNTAEIFGCTEKEEFRFGLRYFFTYCKRWPPRAGAAEAVRMLKGQGHSLYEITARKFAAESTPLGRYSKRIFEGWLKKHGFEFDGIFYCSESRISEDKLEGCRKISADIMIDDRPETALYLAENGIRVFLYDTAYNKDVSHEKITRVFSWEDVCEKVSALY